MVRHDTSRKTRQVLPRHVRVQSRVAGGIGGGGGGEGGREAGGCWAKQLGATALTTRCTSAAPNLKERATSRPGTAVGSLPAHSK